MTGYDVITLGETMLRFTPPGQKLLEQAQALEVHVGGSESNVAVGLARLGWRVAWVSRLTSNPFGHTINNALRAQGVDTSHVVWTDKDRVGLYIVEQGPPPRGGRVTYDRANSAISRMTPDDLPPNLFDRNTPGWLHLTGITPAIGAGAVALAATERAKAAGWRVSFDVNHRAKLWTAEEAAAGCDALLTLADLVFIAARDAAALYGVEASPEATLRALRQRWENKTIVMTLGADGAAAIRPDGATAHQAIFPAEGNGRVGGGDAFVAGFLSEYIASGELEKALQWGAAAAAYKYTLPGDMPLLVRSELRHILDGDSKTLSR